MEKKTCKLGRLVSESSGISRRKSFSAVMEGKVTVDGRVVRDPAFPVVPGVNEVRLDGNLIHYLGEKVYVMLHKPSGVVTSMSDPKGRKTIAHIVDNVYPRVYPVGRLDYHSTGLLLLTNDGEMAYKLTHPKYGVEKVYVAKVKGIPGKRVLNILRRGIELGGRKTLPGSFDVIETRKDKAWVRVKIVEGRYRQIRMMFAKVGHPVMKLRRVGYANLSLGDMAPGEWRYLTKREIEGLKKYIDSKETELSRI